jgi:Dolichyl-phosphate-mannose-protein mannosyltransferase
VRWRQGVPPLAQYQDRDYGVVFEAPAFALEHLFRVRDTREIYMFRHLLTFLVSFGGVWAVYRLASRRFSDWRIGLLSALFLVLTPRMFAESFYNSKDIVFVAVFAAAMNTTISFVLRPGIKTALLNALVTAVAIDVRIMAILLVIVAVIILVVRLIRREIPLGRTSLLLALYLICSAALVVLMWPYLWSRPLAHFGQAFRNMSQFRWGSEVRYLGAFIPATALPWHYSLTWISITTPLLYTGLFVIGTLATCRKIIMRGFRLWQEDEELQDIIFLVLVLAPLSAVMVFHSVLYDGWRQLYFVYPAFLLLSTRGWMALWSIEPVRKICRICLVIVTGVSVGWIIVWMSRAHPLQNVYFNILAGQDIKERFEMDYWGLSNRKALEYILEKDSSPVITVWADSWTPLAYSLLILKREDRRRLRIADDKQIPYYAITNYRAVKGNDSAKYDRGYQAFYEVKVGHEIILSVFKGE